MLKKEEKVVKYTKVLAFLKKAVGDGAGHISRKGCVFIMKRKNLIIGLALTTLLTLSACAEEKKENDYSDAAVILKEVKTTQFFTDEKVSDPDVTRILAAGINAPSAMNTQPWHFTAILNKEVMQKIADDMEATKPPAGKEGDKPAVTGDKADFSKAPTKAGVSDAPLAIVISCEEGAELSAGLAVQNMSVEAQLLGYGTKIFTSPTMILNGEKREEYMELLSIPENQKVAAVLIVGKAEAEDENPDAISSATSRKDFEEVVTIINE